MSGAAAVAGYLTGGLAQVWVLTAVNWVASLAFTFLAGGGPTLPVYTSTLVFVLMGVSALAQIALAAVFYAAAARKFARNDVPAFDPPLARILVALVAVVSGIGLGEWPSLARFAVFTSVSEKVRFQCVVTLVALALVALVPVVGAARDKAAWAYRRTIDPAGAGRGPAGFVFSAVVATFATFGVLIPVLARLAPPALPILNSSDPRLVSPLPAVAGLVVAFFLTTVTIGAMARMTVTRRPALPLPLVFCLIFLWALPPFADLACEVATQRVWREARSILLALSPVGTWAVLLGICRAPVVEALVVQAALACAAVLLGRRTVPRALNPDANPPGL